MKTILLISLAALHLTSCSPWQWEQRRQQKAWEKLNKTPPETRPDPTWADLLPPHWNSGL